MNVTSSKSSVMKNGKIRQVHQLANGRKRVVIADATKKSHAKTAKQRKAAKKSRKINRGK